MKPTIKLIYKTDNIERTDKDIEKAMRSIGYTFYGAGYNKLTGERDISFEPMPNPEVELKDQYTLEELVIMYDQDMLRELLENLDYIASEIDINSDFDVGDGQTVREAYETIERLNKAVTELTHGDLDVVDYEGKKYALIELETLTNNNCTALNNKK